MVTSPLPTEIRTDAFAARLYRYVKFNGSCWEFDGARDGDGYPTIKIAKKKVRAHRASYYLHIGDIPEGALICHKCDNPSCINPRHLFAGSNRDNMLDASGKGRLPVGPNNSLVKFKQRVAAGLASPPRCIGKAGEKNSQATLKEADVLAIRSRYAAGIDTHSTLAKVYGVTKGCIAHIVTRKSWKHI